METETQFVDADTTATTSVKDTTKQSAGKADSTKRDTSKTANAPLLFSQSPPIKSGRQIYRGDMGSKRGLLFYTDPSKSMTLVYDTVTCGLISIWRGTAIGPIRNSDSSYAPQGLVYLKSDLKQYWTILNGKDTVASKVRMSDVREDTLGNLFITYTLLLPNNKVLTVLEAPRHDAQSGDHALLRNFTCSGLNGLDTNTTIHIGVSGSSPNWNPAYSQSANGLLDAATHVETMILKDTLLSQLKINWNGSADF